MPSLVTVDVDRFVGDEPTGPDTVGDLCLGAEFKFLMLGTPHAATLTGCLRGSLGSLEASQNRAHATLARAISRKKEKKRYASGGTKVVLQPQAVSKPEIVQAGLGEKNYWASHWIVKKANSVEHRPEDPRPSSRHTHGVAVSVELNSPKLAWRDATVPRLVKKVLSRVRKFPTHVNYTCDMHVHVGRCDGTAFSLVTLKKLATVFWLAEPIVRSVRDPHSPNFTHAYTWGFELRQYSRLAMALANTHPAADPVKIGQEMLARVRSGDCDAERVAEWYQYMDGVSRSDAQYEALCAIWRCATPQQLGLLLSGTQREHRRLGFNFSAFGGEDARARTNPRTVEYRFLEGTLEDDLVLGWLQICGKLAELGMKGRQADFHKTVQYLVTQQATYEELRLCLDLLPTRPLSALDGPARDVLFGDFMGRIGVSESAYGPFQDKIRREYKAV